MADFAKLPTGVKLQLKPFKANVDEQKLQDMKQLLALSPVGPAVFENSESLNRRYGLTRDWLVQAKAYWLEKFDWRKHEERFNSFPQFTATVKDDSGHELEVHFLALFSQKPDAIPVAFFHGWPGSFCEFLDMAETLKSRHTAQDLPYHVIVPSLPGYGYSGGPPLNDDYGLEDIAAVMNNLMLGLGFDSYLAQGGDIGCFLSQQLAITYEACKGIHLNFLPMPPPDNAAQLSLSELEQKAVLRRERWANEGTAYAHEHGTRTATVGLALASSPLALLCWIGEKFLEWSDEDPPLDKILEGVTLYWLTSSQSRGIYFYRGSSGSEERPRIASLAGKGRPRIPISKPVGYSFFPKELRPTPVSWVRTLHNVVSASVHSSGGHFAAIEKPQELLADVEEWIPKAWSG